MKTMSLQIKVLLQLNGPCVNHINIEIEEYGTYLGIQVNDEKSLLWIAREGLKASLPANWYVSYNPTNNPVNPYM